MDPKDVAGVRMPPAQERGSTSPRVIEALLVEFDEFDPETAKLEYPWADRFVMGLPLAPWQREFKWSQAQCQRFISSAWAGVHLGAYIVTLSDFRDRSPGGVEYGPLSNMVIDGQQRLKALELYVTNQLPVPDANGAPAYWKDVCVYDKRRFKGTHFSRGELAVTSEHELRAFYDTLNFGGVAHEQHERALDASGTPAKAAVIRPTKASRP